MVPWSHSPTSSAARPLPPVSISAEVYPQRLDARLQESMVWTWHYLAEAQEAVRICKGHFPRISQKPPWRKMGLVSARLCS